MPWKELGYAVGFVVFLAALYVGSYYATVEKGVWMVNTTCWVEYRFGDEWAKWFFSPIHFLDGEIRPKFWEHENEFQAPL
jgi:hypothetical protein